VVRPARPDDAAVIASLLGELGYPTSAEAVGRRLEALGSDDVVLLADEGAGMIALHRIPRLAEGSPLVRVTALVVRADGRRTGVAGSLMAAADEMARGWGCTLMEISCGRRPERAAAHRFYSAAGFADTAERSVRYWKSLD